MDSKGRLSRRIEVQRSFIITLSLNFPILMEQDLIDVMYSSRMDVYVLSSGLKRKKKQESRDGRIS